MKTTSQRWARVLLLGTAAAGLVATAAALVQAGRQDSQLPEGGAVADLPDLNVDAFGDYPPPAMSLEELTSKAALVVIGRVVDIAYAGEILPDNWEELKAEGLPDQALESPGVDVSHVTFEISEYVKGSPAEVLSVASDTILLQYLGDLTREGAIPAGASGLYGGEEVLLFGGWNGYSAVDGRPTYGVVDRALGVFMRGPGDTVTYGDSGQTVVPYTRGFDFDEVLARIRQFSGE